MKKFLALALAVAATSSAAFAQTTVGSYGSSATALVSGSVTYPVYITRQHDMNLGTTLRTAVAQNLSVSPNDMANAAAFKVKGDAGDLVTMTLDATVTLTSDHVTLPGAPGAPHNVTDANTNTIVLTTNHKERYVDNDQAGAVTWYTPFSLASNGYSDGGGTVSGLDPGQGQMNVYVGGTYTIANDQQRGNYSGLLNASVAYAN